MSEKPRAVYAEGPRNAAHCAARLSGLCKTYAPGGKTVKALDGFSLEIERGSFTVIAGRSGCGKTTLLKCIAGLEKPDSGAVQTRARIGFMFQDPRLLPWLTVAENLKLALPKAGAGDCIAGTLKLVGLEGWGGAYPRQLSGGMAQRAALARCLCRKPELLLLDEPLSALDSFTRKRLRRELDELRQALGLTAVLVTHDIEEAVYLGDKVVLMSAGKLAAEFTTTLPRPRDYRSREFQELRAEIEEQGGNDD